MKQARPMGRIRMRRGHSGISLLEMIIAIAIVAFALFGMVSVIAFTTRSNLATKQRVLAMRAAERKIEQMSTTSDLSDIVTNYKDVGIGYPKTGFGIDGVDGLNESNVSPALVGQIVFVKLPVAADGKIDETLTGALLGTDVAAAANIDLDGDGANTNTDVDPLQLKVLPAKVEVKWKGVMGTSRLVYQYIYLKK